MIVIIETETEKNRKKEEEIIISDRMSNLIYITSIEPANKLLSTNHQIMWVNAFDQFERI